MFVTVIVIFFYCASAVLLLIMFLFVVAILIIITVIVIAIVIVIVIVTVIAIVLFIVIVVPAVEAVQPTRKPQVFRWLQMPASHPPDPTGQSIVGRDLTIYIIVIIHIYLGQENRFNQWTKQYDELMLFFTYMIANLHI